MPAFLAALEATGFWKGLSRALCARCGFREVGIHEPHGQRWRVADVVIVERLLGAAILR